MNNTSKVLKIAIYADGANREMILKRYRDRSVQGFTTNPSLIAKAGVSHYADFAKSILSDIKDLPISFEVLSDELDQMKREALVIGDWGPQVYIKIPIINTQGTSTLPLIRELLDRDLKVNVTALFTEKQIQDLRSILKPQDDVLVSIFAGRIADTGIDPIPLMRKSVLDYKDLTGSQILWASCRETFNIYQANDCGCHIITATDDQISKLSLRGRSLEECSLDTVKGFFKDATQAGLKL